MEYGKCPNTVYPYKKRKGDQMQSTKRKEEFVTFPLSVFEIADTIDDLED